MTEKEKAKGKAVIVGEQKSFLFMGLKNRLSDCGIEGIYSSPNIADLKSKGGKLDPIIYYAGDELYSHIGKDFLEGLKSLCLEEGRFLILVGEKSEYTKVTETIPKSAIVKWYPRPVDVDALLITIQDCLKGYIKPAKRHHILIVDDDIVYLSMLNEILKDIYRITTVDSGEKAMTWLYENRVDLILLDYEMPETDGPEVFSMLKSKEHLKHIPIMFLTGKQDRESVMKVLALGPEDYILKSGDKKILLDKLEKYFEKERLKAEANAAALPDLSDIEKLLAELNM